MGASCSKGHGRTVEPVPADEPTADFDQLIVDDSAADCLPAGYRAKRRQAVSAQTSQRIWVITDRTSCCKSTHCINLVWPGVSLSSPCFQSSRVLYSIGAFTTDSTDFVHRLVPRWLPPHLRIQLHCKKYTRAQMLKRVSELPCSIASCSLV